MIFIFLIITINNFIFITKSNNKMGNCSSNAPAAYAAPSETAPADSPWIRNKRGKEVCRLCDLGPRRRRPTKEEVASGEYAVCFACGLQIPLNPVDCCAVNSLIGDPNAK